MSQRDKGKAECERQKQVYINTYNQKDNNKKCTKMNRNMEINWLYKMNNIPKHINMAMLLK